MEAFMYKKYLEDFPWIKDTFDLNCNRELDPMEVQFALDQMETILTKSDSPEQQLYMNWPLLALKLRHQVQWMNVSDAK